MKLSSPSTRDPLQKPSDHHDGERFFNPTLGGRFSPSLADVFRMMRHGRATWPKRVESKGSPDLLRAEESDTMAITFVNHVTFLIQLGGFNILTDPVWSTRASPFAWLGPRRVRAPGIGLESLPDIHVIVISHNHYDHLDLGTLRALAAGPVQPKVIVPVGDRKLVESTGIEDVEELDWWEHVDLDPDTRITFAPTQHSSARGLSDRDRSLWGSHFIQHRRRSIYFGGDSGYSTHFRDIANRLGPPDVALLGIGSFAPRFFMKPIHMDPSEAVAAHRDLRARQSIGMHFGTFQLSAEAIGQPETELKEALEREGLPPDCFITLQEGETRRWAGEEADLFCVEPAPAGGGPCA